MAAKKPVHDHPRQVGTDSLTVDYCCTTTHPEQEFETRLMDPTRPLSAQVCQQVYAGGRNSAMSFGSHLPDPRDTCWPDTDDRFGSLLRKGNR